MFRSSLILSGPSFASRLPFGALVFCASLAFLGACESKGVAASDGGADGGLSQCSGVSTQTIRALEAGLVQIELNASSGVTEATGSEGVVAWIENQKVYARMPAGATARHIDLRCAAGISRVPVEVAKHVWEPLTTWEGNAGPKAREYFAMWQDAADAKLYVYGGFVYEPRQFTPSSELWSLDLTSKTWTLMTQTGTSPDPGGRVARGSLADTIFYRGGSVLNTNGSIATPPTFRSLSVSGNAGVWTDVPNPGTPDIGDYTGALVYDEAHQRWLAICGVDASIGYHCGVRQYTATEGWKLLSPTSEGRPRGRNGFAYGLDRANQRVVIFGGDRTNTILGDTWSLDISGETVAWTQISESSEIASKRRNGGWAIDESNHALVVWGGTPDGATSVQGVDVLALDRDREQWIHLEGPAGIPSRTSAGGLYDPTRKRMVFGFGNDDDIYADLYSVSVVP